MEGSGLERAERLRASWDANAEAWTRTVREGRIASRRAGTDAAIVRAVVDHVRPGGRVLDVGCGEGWLARALGAEGFQVLGVDGSAPLIERARQLGGGEFRVLSYEAIVAEPARVGAPYDAAVCNFALLGDDASVAVLVAALRGQLAPGGSLLIQTVHPFTAGSDAPYRDGWREESFAGFGDAFAEPMPWYFRTAASWLRLVRASGLTLVDCREPLDLATGRPLSWLLVCGEDRLPASRGA